MRVRGRVRVGARVRVSVRVRVGAWGSRGIFLPPSSLRRASSVTSASLVRLFFASMYLVRVRVGVRARVRVRVRVRV